MTHEVNGQEDEGATPDLKKSARGRISWIWTIPVIAMLLGAGLVIQTYLSQGPTIEIEFPVAAGLKAGATPIKFLSVEVGLVTEIRLKDTLDGVVAVAELEPGAESYLKEGTVFWLVRPQLSLAGISALETLLSGQYIEVVPSEEGKPTTRFEGRMNPPIGARYPNAKTVVLEAPRLGSITQGTPVFYKNLRAGEVEHYELGEGDDPIRIYTVIDQGFASRVQESSLFWNASGIEAHLGLDGVDIRTEGLAAILGGSIAFSSGVGGSAEAAVDSSFVLYDGADEARRAQRRSQSLALQLEARHGQSPRDGSPIFYRGLEIGQIGRSQLTSDALAVRFEAFIEERFQTLVREGSRFYKTSGLDVSVGLDGLRVDSESLESIAIGGVSLATPDAPGDPVAAGTLFALHDRPEEAWLAWRPSIELPGAETGEPVEHRLPPEPDAGSLELVLHAEEIGSVTRSSAITYRDLPVGRVVDYSLSKNGESVLFRVRVERPYRHLIGSNTRFWKAAGLSVDVGLHGIEAEIGSLRTLAVGGIAFDNSRAAGASSQNGAGEPAKQLARFELYPDESMAWLDFHELEYLTVFVEAPESILSRGAPVYFRKHKIGEVADSRLTTGARAVQIGLQIERQYAPLVRANSRFWSPSSVNVEGGLGGIELEVAPLAALLAGGVMLATPSAEAEAKEGTVFRLEPSAPDGWVHWRPELTLVAGVPAAFKPSEPAGNALRLLLVARQVESLGAGDPIYYRGMQIGEVGSPRLGPDGREVLLDAEVGAEYARLIRTNTQFWNASGIDVDLGWGGLNLETGALDTLVRGGVQIAIPDRPGDPADPGQRFPLLTEPDEDWQTWSPELL